MVNLGSAGNSNTMVRLFCNLMPHGWGLVRLGWRKGIPTPSAGKDCTWVFCPLLHDKFPRDRVLVEECEKCEHYKGVSHSLKRIAQSSQMDSWKPNIIRPQVRPRKKPKKVFPQEDIDKAIEEKRREDEEWLEEERRIFGNSTSRRVDKD